MRVRIEQHEEHSFAERKATMVALRERALFRPTRNQASDFVFCHHYPTGRAGFIGPGDGQPTPPEFSAGCRRASELGSSKHTLSRSDHGCLSLRERALFNPTATKRATLFSATTLQLGEPGSLGPEKSSRRHPSFRQAADAFQNWAARGTLFRGAKGDHGFALRQSTTRRPEATIGY